MMQVCSCCNDARPIVALPATRARATLRKTPVPAPDDRATKQAPSCRAMTVGHSTRPIEVFIELLRAHEVDRLIDVRTVPRSRRNPQFNADALPVSLAAAGIAFASAPGLGGFRRTSAESPNAGWRNLSFRGYADYMQTAEFKSHLDELIALTRTERVALMCAEAVPWRCHRSLIADALMVHGVPVCEIASATRAPPHKLTSFACVRGLEITYPPEEA